MKNKHSFIDAHHAGIYILLGIGFAIMIWGLFFYHYTLPKTDASEVTSFSTIKRDLKKAFSLFSAEQQKSALPSDEQNVEVLREKVFGHLE